MAYQASNLEMLAGGGAGITLWGYVSTADAKATIDTTGYFNIARDLVRVGDWLIINASDGYGIFIVNQNDGANVDITDGTAVGTADLD